MDASTSEAAVKRQEMASMAYFSLLKTFLISSRSDTASLLMCHVNFA